MRRLLICSVLPFALIACSSDEATLPQGNEGGSAGSGGTAGTSGSGGTAGSGASGGSAGSGASGGAAGSGASGGSAGTAGAGGTGQQCDPTSAPGEDACVIDDEYAIFVSPNGDDSAGDGSMASPFASIAKGITEAIAAGKRLYACADGGSYDEQVALDANNAGVSAWGSFKCSDWTYDNSLKATIAPSAEGFALSASGVNATTRLEGFEFQAQSATAAGGSSIAAFVKDSSALTLVNVKLVAGDGMKGADGQTPVSTFPALIDLMGNTGEALALPTLQGRGGAQKIYGACPNGGSTTGGAGGQGDTNLPTAGGDGGPASLGGKGGPTKANTPDPLPSCGAGGTREGSSAPPAAPGNGANTTGSLVSDVWTPEDGSNGAPGMPGGGGGGGRGGTLGGGGGGGAGGCGGAGGAPGQGGGASIALLAIEAPINLVNVEFVSASAGNGGAGSAGENGMALGGDPGGGVGGACTGGQGGAGGKGGAGGGGAGGIAVGLVFTGNQPTLSGESFSAGTAGAAGPGGDSSNAGVAGVAQDTLDLN